MTGCSVVRCKSRTEKGQKMHRFPADEATRLVWMRLCGRADDWRPGPGSRICELHFSPETRPSRKLRGVVPTVVCTRQLVSSSHSTLPVDHQHYCKQISSTNCRIHCCIPRSPPPNPLVQQLRQENEKLRREAEELHKAALVTSKFTESFSDAQRAAAISGNSRGRKWPLSDIRTAMSLSWSAGPSALKAAQKSKNVAPLPSLRSIQRRTQHIKFEPGVLHEVLECFETLIETFEPLDKDCVLLFDDMSIVTKHDMDPSTGKYIGKVTLPGVVGMATKATLYMFAGIRARWKIPVAYHFVPDAFHSEIQAQILKDLLCIGHRLKLNIIAVVCDMGNRSITNSLGFSTKKCNRKYSIPHPFNSGLPLFLVPDSVHVFKSLKESLVNNSYIILSESLVKELNLASNCVKLSHIEWLDEHQQDMFLQFAPQLSRKDINASHFNKMKSSSAKNVLNHKVGNGLKYKVMTGEAPAEFSTTAWFIALMNRWFELMTSRSLVLALSNKNKNAYEEAINHLKMVIKVFQNMGFPGGWKPVQTHIILVTEVILEIQDYLLNKRGYDFVFLARFLQDVVENMFSLIRSKRKNPTALHFKQSLRQIVVSRLHLKVKGSSYDFDDREDPVDLLLTPPQPKKPKLSAEVTTFPAWEDPPNGQLFGKGQDDILYRMCGYTVHRLIERGSLKCDGCLAFLLHQDPEPHRNSLWVKLTNYKEGSQISVSDEVYQLLRSVEFNLLKWKPILLDLKDSALSFLLEKFRPHLSSYSLATCHEFKETLVQYWLSMRLKQLTVNLTGRRKVESQSQLSSKSMGARLLCEKFSIPCPKSSKNYVRSQAPTQQPLQQKNIAPHFAQSNQVSKVATTTAKIDCIENIPPASQFKNNPPIIVKIPRIDCRVNAPVKRKKRSIVPPPSATFLSTVTNKLSGFHSGK